ncbi:MAG: c-type cytochrome [Burkholderiaceae bacterium]
MNIFLLSLGLMSCVSLSHAQSPANGQAMAGKHGCLICHNVEGKAVGPAFKEVAQKYRGQDEANTLFLRVKNGGAGQWGRVPMPAHPNVPEADIKDLVAWVLGLS